MAHVFGPAPSRRLGSSLGIDPIPFKTCNWSCVYCQLGRTRPLTRERRIWSPPEEIVAEAAKVLASRGLEGIDWLTFVGSGEPTLHQSLGWMIRRLKEITDLPIAVITNGSLLFREDVREELLPADAVLPTLDAGSERLHRRINRPHPDFTFDRLVEGLVAFRRIYEGKLWVEVMLLSGINDTEQALLELQAVLQRLGPDEIHLNIPVRPPSEAGIGRPDPEALRRASTILGSIAPLAYPEATGFRLPRVGELAETIEEIVIRHPMRTDELIRILEAWPAVEVEAAIEGLADGGGIRGVARWGQLYWRHPEARYGESQGRERPGGDP